MVALDLTIVNVALPPSRPRTTATDRNLATYAEVLNPFGQVVAIDDYDSLEIGVLKPKSISFHWKFMFTRSMFHTPDHATKHHILTEIARLADAGILTSTATQHLGPVNAANLRRAHRVLESGTAIGKTTLAGFQSCDAAWLRLARCPC